MKLSNRRPRNRSFTGHTRPPIWRNTSVLKWLVQIVVLVAVLAVFWFLAAQARPNHAAKGIPVSYDWLDEPANIQLGEGIQTVDTEERRLTMSRALWVGMVNTLRIASIGIIVSTIIGIARRYRSALKELAGSESFVDLRRDPPQRAGSRSDHSLARHLGLARQVDGRLGPDSRLGHRLPEGHLASAGVPRRRLLPSSSRWCSSRWIPVWFVRRSLKRRQDREGGNTHATGLHPRGVRRDRRDRMVREPGHGVPRSDLRGSGVRVGLDSPGGSCNSCSASPRSAAAVLWIKRFLDSRRTPAGLAKLIDDDWFRMIFAVVAALLAVLVVVRGWPGLSSWIINSGSDLFGVIADKFGDGRGSRPIDAMKPTLSEGRFVNYGPTGLTMTVFYASLFFGLVFYTSSFIAEIVRGGILAVPAGQSEAAAALGLSRSQALRKVVLPQAFRVIMPPLGNQYLNITKNTSLGIAVGFSEIVQVGQTVYNKNSQTLAVFSIYMVFYLACSLSISSVVNTINRRLAIVER